MWFGWFLRSRKKRHSQPLFIALLDINFPGGAEFNGTEMACIPVLVADQVGGCVHFDACIGQDIAAR